MKPTDAQPVHLLAGWGRAEANRCSTCKGLWSDRETDRHQCRPSGVDQSAETFWPSRVFPMDVTCVRDFDPTNFDLRQGLAWHGAR